MAQTLPNWLNKSFLAKSLQGGEDIETTVTVNDFSAVLAVAAGNNYSSQIFRVQIKYKSERAEEQSTTLIIKAPITQFQEMKELGLGCLFDKEPIMYNKILPRMKEKIKCDFGPTTYYSSQKGVMVLQDMKEAGYIMSDKVKQLDYAHCEIVFKTLAKFHAASVALHNDTPDEIEKIGVEPIFVEGHPFIQMLKPLLGYALGAVVDTIKKTEDSEPTIQFLLNKEENLIESITKLCKPKKTGLNVLNHGDLWNNNILFKHSDSGEVVDIKFIDYQALRYMTPAVDILYFTWSSADEEVRENRLHELYDVYLNTLNDSFEELGCEERYTSEELWQDIKSSINFALGVIFQTFPLMMAEPEDVFDISEYEMKDFMNMVNAVDPNMLRIYNGRNFKAKVPTIVKQLYKLENA